MSYFSAQLFSWLQGAEFYMEFHHAVLKSFPEGQGKKWIDVGCGPGLLTRLSAAKGYDATGMDVDPFMIREARKIALRERSSARFEIGDISRLRPQSADIVSASSLLAALDDRVGAFHLLLRAVQPAGTLLIIEPTDRMTPQAINVLARERLRGKRISGLRLWACARQGRAVDPAIFGAVGTSVTSFPLLGGLVRAWLVRQS